MALENPQNRAQAFDLGEFRVDPQRRTISGPSGEVTIEPKIMAVLVMLAGRPGEVVTRQAFIDSIWATEYGGDESLTRAVSHLRKILGDAHGMHTHIETVPKTGYRLVKQQELSALPETRRRRHRIIALALIGLLAFAVAAVVYLRQQVEESRPEAPPGKASIVIAVLPFDIQGASAEDEGLAFGVADEILSALSRNPSIAVIAGNSSFQFRGNSKSDLSALNERLNISHVVDGSLRRSPEGLRLGVHLIDINSGLVQWSDVVTRPEQEIYSIPPQVAAAVQTALGADPVESHARVDVPDPEAYEVYLYARSLLHNPIGPNLDLAIGQLERAINLDPKLSEAWSTLAMTRLETLKFRGSGGPDQRDFDPSVYLEAARREANAALAIDPDSVEARLALAIVDYSEQSVSLAENFNQVRMLWERAPHHPKVNFQMGVLMGQVGRFEEASKYLARAFELDPLTELNAALYADVLTSGGRIEEALNFIRMMGVHAWWQRTYTGLIMHLLWADFQTARDAFTKLGPNDVFFSTGVFELQNVNVKSPNTERLSQIMARLIDVTENGDISTDPALASDLIKATDEGLIVHFYTAQLLAVAGFRDAALEMVRERLAAGDILVRESGILARPAFIQARQDPGIMKWFDITGQLEYWMETGAWPDFCTDPELPYDCETVAK